MLSAFSIAGFKYLPSPHSSTLWPFPRWESALPKKTTAPRSIRFFFIRTSSRWGLGALLLCDPRACGCTPASPSKPRRDQAYCLQRSRRYESAHLLVPPLHLCDVEACHPSSLSCELPWLPIFRYESTRIFLHGLETASHQ